MKIAIWTFCLTIAAGFFALIAFACSGSYQIAADKPHGAFMGWLIHETAEHAVIKNARAVQVPSGLDSPKRIAEGGRDYKAMCAVCHMGPGQQESEMRQGLNPMPPQLAKTAGSISPARIFWVVKHGIKMTAMPAWGETHNDEKLWDIAAFVKYRLPSMTPAAYAAITPENEAHEASAGN